MRTSNAAIELLAPNLQLHPDKDAYFCGILITDRYALKLRSLSDFRNFIQPGA